MRFSFRALCMFLLSLGMVSAQAQDTISNRYYQIGVYNQLDLRNVSTNSVAVHRALHDGFKKGIKPRLGPKLGNITYGLFSFSTTYLTMLWSHEFGHSLRAQQVGGRFNIHNFALPYPYTTMTLPEDINLVDETLSVTGGFEVNYLQVRDLQSQFIQEDGLTNDDLALSFANRLMFPLYTTLLIRVDPSDPNTWINTAGDPVHIVLPVFQNFANGQVFLGDGSVNPELVQFYQEAALFGTFFNLLDPNFYREAGATFGKDKVRKPLFMVGNQERGWTYGTMFNMSPLGYELYLRNYLHLAGQQFGFYLKYGRPFRNNGLGLSWHNMLPNQKLQLSTQLEFWEQERFGRGASAELSLSYPLGRHFDVIAVGGYKTEGYLLGKQIGQGVNLGFNLRYYPYR